MLSTISDSARYIQCLADVFYPVACMGCGRDLYQTQGLFCPACSTDLPSCEFSRMSNNRGELLFRGRVDVQSVASLYYFKKKGVVQKLMHALKYGGRQDIGERLGRALGGEMIASGRFGGIELVVPVPLHPRKKRARGYNQASRFGQALSETLGVPCREDVLERTVPGASQTRKGRVSRNRSLMDSFCVKHFKDLKYKHILIVDDIITSGATLEACARTVLRVPGTRVSLASMAFTL